MNGVVPMALSYGLLDSLYIVTIIVVKSVNDRVWTATVVLNTLPSSLYNHIFV